MRFKPKEKEAFRLYAMGALRELGYEPRLQDRETALRIGDTLIKPDSNETYTLSSLGTLVGVYNINKGYADFKLINVLRNS